MLPIFTITVKPAHKALEKNMQGGVHDEDREGHHHVEVERGGHGESGRQFGKYWFKSVNEIIYKIPLHLFRLKAMYEN